jgi:hypothetical protein
MSTTTTRTPTPAGIPAAALRRVLDEGHGPDAWYGADVRAAIADVGPAEAFRRPGKGRHNIAEIALHHAFWVREVRRRLTGSVAEPFPLEGEDWFELADGRPLGWSQVVAALEAETGRIAHAVEGLATGRVSSPLSEIERFDQVLGIAAHGAYHAGQIQLVKKLI